MAVEVLFSVAAGITEGDAGLESCRWFQNSSNTLNCDYESAMTHVGHVEQLLWVYFALLLLRCWPSSMSMKK